MDTQAYSLRPSKHFVLTWMRKWDYDVLQLRNALENAQNVVKVGKNKYEAYIKTKKGGRKLIFVMDDEYKEIFIITGAEGK